MNQTQAKEWLPLIKALAEGKTLQISSARSAQDYMDGVYPKWEDINGAPFAQNQFTSSIHYRIKPEPKTLSYRVGLFKNEQEYFAMLCRDSDSEGKYFVRWLTDRIEYELPEGEA